MPRVTCRAVLAAFVVALVTSCGRPGTADTRPLVLTSTTVFADMARNVAGERMRVESIVPTGAQV